MENEHERRTCRRFEMTLPATVIRPSSSFYGDMHHLMLTRDISHAGAYFSLMKPFSCEGPVRIELLLEVAGGRTPGMYVYMTASGEIVRRDERGLAVIFHEDFRLAPFPIK